jgi:hypothetical protein
MKLTTRKENIVLPERMSNEELGEYVASESVGILKRMDVLKPFFVELWKRFDRLKDGETIQGCRTRTEFCDKILHRTRRSVQYILHGRTNTKPLLAPQNHKREIPANPTPQSKALKQILNIHIWKHLREAHGIVKPKDAIFPVQHATPCDSIRTVSQAASGPSAYTCDYCAGKALPADAAPLEITPADAIPQIVKLIDELTIEMSQADKDIVYESLRSHCEEKLAVTK